jgi:hypothetical protein
MLRWTHWDYEKRDKAGLRALEDDYQPMLHATKRIIHDAVS